MGDFSALTGTAFVVGGTGGIGSEIVRTLVARGSRVAFTYNGNERKAAQLVDDGAAASHRLELSDADDVLRLADSVAEHAGGVHTVVYAAGPHVPMRHLSTVGTGDFGYQVNTDVGGFFNLVSAVLAHLRRSQGSLVAVTTAATKRFAVRDGLSVAPKAAIECQAMFSSAAGMLPRCTTRLARCAQANPRSVIEHRPGTGTLDIKGNCSKYRR